MSRQIPVPVWDAEPVGLRGRGAQLREPLRAAATDRRIAVLRLLAAGRMDATRIAEELQADAGEVRDDLQALADAGLVRADAGESGEVYQLANQALRLLGTTLSYGVQRPPVKRRFRARTPLPPLACTVCDNRGFVSDVLRELGAAMDEARTYHRRIQEMSSQVLTAHEAERKRIARELHDDTAQALTSILVRLQLLERSTADEEIHRNVAELRELTAGALDSVRRMAMDLRPAALDDLGLVPAVHSYVERFSNNWPVKVTVSIGGLKRRLPADIEVVLYRVVQEALTNVAKHAQASEALVTLKRVRNTVTLTVADNGAGFDATRSPGQDGSGLGLFGMRERLALVGGELSIDSAAGRGTRISARVPLRRK